MSFLDIHVLHAGGSLIWDSKKNTPHTGNIGILVDFINRNSGKFIIVAGGGKLARDCRDALLKVNPHASKDSLDRVGIAATKTNASVLSEALGQESFLDHEPIPGEVDAFRKCGKALVVSGWEPGGSTNWISVRCAIAYGATRVVNLSNRALYTQDPEKSENARLIHEISWPTARKMLPHERTPGMHFPMDPVAAMLAMEAGIAIAIIEGMDSANLLKAIRRKEFKGTLIY